MDPRDEELRRENMAKAAELQAQVEKLQRNYKKRKPSRNWLVIPLLAFVIGLRTWELYTRRNGGWPAVFTLRNWVGRLQWYDIVFPSLMLAVLIWAFIDRHLTTKRQEREMRAEADWRRQLDALVDIKDYPDQEDLYYYLEDDQLPRVLAALERQPKGARSLRAAVMAVDPELVA